MISSTPSELQRIVAVCFLISLTCGCSKSQKAILGEWRAEGATLGASADGQLVLRVPDSGGRMIELKGTYVLVKAGSDGADFRISIPKHTPETQGKAKVVGDTLTLRLFSDAQSPQNNPGIAFRKTASQTKDKLKSKYLGTWEAINFHSAHLFIEDNGPNLVIRQDWPDQTTFTATIDPTGDLQTSLNYKISYIRSSGHLARWQEEYQKLSDSAQ